MAYGANDLILFNFYSKQQFSHSVITLDSHFYQFHKRIIIHKDIELDSKLYLHDSDKVALAALKAIPGFTQVMRAFMKVWNEQHVKNYGLRFLKYM